MSTATRNATLADLAEILAQQQARKLDVIVPAIHLRADGGDLVIDGAAPLIEDDGVTDPNGRYRLTDVCDEGVADKLGIPLSYVRRMRADRADLWDANVNGWLHGGYLAEVGDRDLPGSAGPGSDYHWAPDPRSFLLRCFRSDDGELGVARALLSDRFGMYDNLDILTAALSGIRDAGVPVEVQGCDLSDRRMYVRVFSPAVAVLAEDLLRGYRSPYSGAEGTDNPTVFAGFEISNSEVGAGAFTITPRLVVQVCSNGLKVTKDVLRRVHLGGQMEHGVVRFSDDTARKNLDLVTAQARDAVATFLDVEYVREKVAAISETAATPLADPAKAVEVVGKRLLFGEDVTRGVLDHFIRSSQVTAGGLLQAVTSYAQVVDDADVAADLEGKAIQAMELAAAL